MFDCRSIICCLMFNDSDVNHSISACSVDWRSKLQAGSLHSRLFTKIVHTFGVFLRLMVESSFALWLPACHQTWQWRIYHLWMILPLKLNLQMIFCPSKTFIFRWCSHIFCPFDFCPTWRFSKLQPQPLWGPSGRGPRQESPTPHRSGKVYRRISQYQWQYQYQ